MALQDVTDVTTGIKLPLLVEYMIFGGMPSSDVFKLVQNVLSAQHLDFTNEEIDILIKEVIGIRKGAPKSIQGRVEDFVTFVTNEGEKSQSVTFTSQDVTIHLALNDVKDKTSCRQALSRLCKSGIIERMGKYGLYRVVNGADRFIDLGDLSDLQEEIQIMFPLGVHQWIKAMPHTIYIIAGETDSGKSAFLLNFAKMNSPNYPVDYHSSEMGKAEFLDRLQYFWTDVAENKNMRFFERSNDFAAAIKRAPDHIHIIDYIQLFDNFFLMAEIIDKIGKALNNGIAFIALQKPKGRDEGLGGERTKDLARLYLSMSPGTLKITKAKNWRNPKVNPNNQQIFFKLAEGCHFFSQGDWHKA